MLGFLGRLGFSCPLFRVCLRFLLVGRLGICLATTGFAAGMSLIVLAYACATTLLAVIAFSVVLAYARPTALLALPASSVVFAYARPTTLLAI